MSIKEFISLEVMFLLLAYLSRREGNTGGLVIVAAAMIILLVDFLRRRVGAS